MSHLEAGERFSHGMNVGWVKWTVKSIKLPSDKPLHNKGTSPFCWKTHGFNWAIFQVQTVGHSQTYEIPMGEPSSSSYDFGMVPA